MTTSRPLQATLWPDSDESTSSPEGSLASLTVWPGSVEARLMTAHSGRRWLPLLRSPDQPTCWLRTFLASSRWSSTFALLTWKHSVTPAGRWLFRLSGSTRHTAGSGSGYWPTMTVVQRDNRSGYEGAPVRPSLESAVRIWPTPTVGGGGNRCELTPYKGHFLRPSGKKAHLGLDQVARMFLTPRASPNENRQTKPTPSQLAGTHGRSLAAEVGGSLNPLFVEWLMGYPANWTNIDLEDSETPSSPKLPTS